VWLTAFDDLDDPRDAALRLAQGAGLAWLDGGLEHGREGRFSFVGSEPCEIVESAADDADALAALDRLHTPRDAAVPSPLAASDVPYWVGHITYDAARRVHASPPHDVPLVRFARYDAWYAFDHRERRAYLVGDDAQACERLRARLAKEPVRHTEYVTGKVAVTSTERHRAAVRAALALIREGELYEINLARRYRARFGGHALGLFLQLRSLSPVPLGYFVDGGDHAILGRSMERFLRLDREHGVLTTSPIKGTIARGGDDPHEAAELASDPKERAEHAMVVDLMRNDLSRVCEVGSVQIAELMAVVPFAGLSHLVSTVQGRVAPDLSLRRLMAETFPPGSVTGAPKERVLRAIEELEQFERGVYTGCMGFVDRAGGCSFAVAIRTAIVAAGHVTYFAGGGIVADSDPQREADETDLKAKIFLRALAQTL